MTRLNDTALKAKLKKARETQEEIVDSAVPGLAVRVGRGPAATWSLSEGRARPGLTAGFEEKRPSLPLELRQDRAPHCPQSLPASRALFLILP